ncbi:MAG: Spy/CpxP family protein refolding chaperone [Gemmatimonadetes bacterium]|nr:Spy/CpxP family protein refolding chaperone [Gemmatimonadota bacterium]
MRRTSFGFAIGALAAAVSFSTIAGAQGQVRARQARPAAPPPGGAAAPAQPPVAGRGAAQPRLRQGAGDGRGGSPAAMILRMRQQLDLTDEQVKRLEALASVTPQRPNPADALRARADLMDATRGDGNLANARAVLDRMAKQRNDVVIARMKAQQDARAVLTAAQKTKLDNVRGMLRARVGARRGGAGVNGRGQMRPGGMGRGQGFRGGRMDRGFGPPRRYDPSMGAGFGAQRRQMGPGFGPQGPQGPQGMRLRGGPGMGQGFGPPGPQGQPPRMRRFEDLGVDSVAVPPATLPPATLPPA